MIRVDETDPVGEVEPSFPYRDVTVRRGVQFKDCYDIQSEIGRGKFGTVYHCKDKTNGLLLAAKVVTTTRKEDRRSVEREVEIMRRLQHPRLIQLYDAIDSGKEIYVILELIQGGELFERVIDDDFVLTERSCAVFMRQICEGIEFVHAQHILHLDMKPENILCLTKEGNRIKIIDFGLARQYDPRKKMQVLFGTPEFVAPEVVNFDQIGFGTDMWSIGVICYVLLSGLSPFMGDTDVETMANVTIAKYDFDHDAFSDISEDAKDFVRSLLVKDKEKRMSATVCRSHRWLAPKIPAPRIIEAKIQQAAVASGSQNELDVAKDNLRLFVERWRDHPDSPYLLESASNEATVQQVNNIESISLRGQSPSPCGSVCSTTSELSEASVDKAAESVMPVSNNVLFGLERRASEGNPTSATTRHHRDPASQIILAEEIIKLSEHLRNLATANPIGGSSTDEKSLKTNKSKSGRPPAPATSSSRETGSKNEISEKLSSITRRRKVNGTTFNGNRSYEKTENIAPFTLKKTRKATKPPEESSSSENSTGTSTRVTWKIDKPDEETETREIDLIPPWRTARGKRRFSETCRDVPRISNLKDIHKDLNLDEPNSTKDLLLHLLGEWDETTRGSVGRKSVSVDWCGPESVARKSMNSLAEYFQSEQRRSTGVGCAVNDPTGPSATIHR